LAIFFLQQDGVFTLAMDIFVGIIFTLRHFQKRNHKWTGTRSSLMGVSYIKTWALLRVIDFIKVATSSGNQCLD